LIGQGNRIKKKAIIFVDVRKNLEFFSAITDPRVVNRCLHKLSDILFGSIVNLGIECNS
jgi:hypothetical protein